MPLIPAHKSQRQMVSVSSRTARVTLWDPISKQQSKAKQNTSHLYTGTKLEKQSLELKNSNHNKIRRFMIKKKQSKTPCSKTLGIWNSASKTSISVSYPLRGIYLPQSIIQMTHNCSKFLFMFFSFINPRYNYLSVFKFITHSFKASDTKTMVMVRNQQTGWRGGSGVKVHNALAGKLGLSSRHPMVAQNALQLQPQWLWHPLLVSKGTRHTCGGHTYMQVTHL